VFWPALARSFFCLTARKGQLSPSPVPASMPLVPLVIDSDRFFLNRWPVRWVEVDSVSARQVAVKKYVVTLSTEEREQLEVLIRTGKHSARKLLRARILLKADASEAGEAWADSQTASGLDSSVMTVARVRQQLVDGVLTPKRSPNSARQRIFDGASEAKLIALACSTPPEGYARWTLQMLEGKVVELNIVTRASDNTIGRTLKNLLKPHLNDQWVIPPDANAAFVAAMEDVIEVYHRLHDPDRPVVCVDETSKQLIIETRTPIPAKPGQPRRVDYEYKRNGTANLFMMFAPLEGWRDVKVTDQRAAVTMHRCSKSCLTRTSRRPARSCSCRTTSAPTRLPRSMQRSRPRRPAASSSGLNGTTRPSTAAGWTWLKANSACCRVSASLGASPTRIP